MNITKGKVTGAAIRAVIYGTEGIGKSTLAAKIPKSITIDTEDGTGQIDCTRALALDWRGIEAAVRELIANPQGFTAVIIDTADWCEKALIENMLGRTGKKSIEDFGYGKGYTALQEEFTRFLNLLDGLIAKGVHVVFVAHSTVKRFSAPDQTDGYDRYEMKLTKQVSPLLKEWADMVLFVNYKIQIVEGTDGKLKAQGGKERIIFTTHSPAWDAKNRFGLAEELPMEYASLAGVFGGNAPRGATIPAVTQPAAPTTSTRQGASEAGDSHKVASGGSTPPPASTPPPTTESDQIPGLEEPVIKLPAALIAWLDANAATVNAYLVRVAWLPAGKSWRVLPEDKLTSILNKTDKFARAANIPTLPAK